MSRDDDRLWQWGKNKGTPLQDLSVDYLQWAVANFAYEKAVKIAVKELEYRNAQVPSDRKIETPEERAMNKLQYEIRKSMAGIQNLAVGLNQLLAASGLQQIALEPEVKRDEKKEGQSKARSSTPVTHTPWEDDGYGSEF